MIKYYLCFFIAGQTEYHGDVVPVIVQSTFLDFFHNVTIVRYISVVYTFGSPYHVEKTGGSHGDTQENTINSGTEKRDML